MLSQYFSEREFTRSDTADRAGIDNTLPPALQADAQWFCRQVLDAIRNFLGKPVIVTSGYRCPQLNKRVGGSRHSYHQYARAADIRVEGMTPFELAEAIMESGIEYDKLILEPSWVHIQGRPLGDNRQETGTVIVRNGETRYETGLFA